MPAVPGFWKHLRERFGKKQTEGAPVNLDGPGGEKANATYRRQATRDGALMAA